MEDVIAGLPKIGPLELDRVLAAFAQTRDDEIGKKLVAALNNPAVRPAVRVDMVKERIKHFGPAVQQEAEKLYAELNKDYQQQRARLDEAVKTSSLDLDFATAQYGPEAVAGFGEALAASKAELGRAFTLRQQLDDEIPEDEPTTRRMLAEIAEYARICDATGWSGIGIPEHHLQVEGFELGQDPGLMAMFLGQHGPRLRINQFGYVLPTHNPLRALATIPEAMGVTRIGAGPMALLHATAPCASMATTIPAPADSPANASSPANGMSAPGVVSSVRVSQRRRPVLSSSPTSVAPADC